MVGIRVEKYSVHGGIVYKTVLTIRIGKYVWTICKKEGEVRKFDYVPLEETVEPYCIKEKIETKIKEQIGKFKKYFM